MHLFPIQVVSWDPDVLGSGVGGWWQNANWAGFMAGDFNLAGFHRTFLVT
jgi:hypothetical protein